MSVNVLFANGKEPCKTIQDPGNNCQIATKIPRGSHSTSPQNFMKIPSWLLEIFCSQEMIIPYTVTHRPASNTLSAPTVYKLTELEKLETNQQSWSQWPSDPAYRLLQTNCRAWQSTPDQWPRPRASYDVLQGHHTNIYQHPLLHSHSSNTQKQW